MSSAKEDDKMYATAEGEPEIVATAVPAGVAPPTGSEPPIPAGHSRFYCNKCHTVRMPNARWALSISVE
jgi:hypothetical protein